MQFVMKYEDGDVCTSSNFNWKQLPRNKNIESFGVHDLEDNFYELEGDTYFFSDEAVSYSGDAPVWISRMIAAFKDGEDKGDFVKVGTDGSVIKEEVSYEEFKNTYADDSFIRSGGMVG